MTHTHIHVNLYLYYVTLCVCKKPCIIRIDTNTVTNSMNIFLCIPFQVPGPQSCSPLPLWRCMEWISEKSEKWWSWRCAGAGGGTVMVKYRHPKGTNKKHAQLCVYIFLLFSVYRQRAIFVALGGFDDWTTCGGRSLCSEVRWIWAFAAEACESLCIRASRESWRVDEWHTVRRAVKGVLTC